MRGAARAARAIACTVKRSLVELMPASAAGGVALAGPPAAFLAGFTARHVHAAARASHHVLAARGPRRRTLARRRAQEAAEQQPGKRDEYQPEQDSPHEGQSL